LRILPKLIDEAVYLAVCVIDAKLRCLAIVIALDFEIQFLCLKLENLVLGVGLPLLGLNEFLPDVLKMWSRR
jgi:hypothetical protein